MKRWVIGILIFAATLGAAWGVAQAQYRPPPASRAYESSGSEEEGFERAVDLTRFRRGNMEWDTQELIASGFTALHREHVRILKELAELKSAVKRLEEKR